MTTLQKGSWRWVSKARRNEREILKITILGGVSFQKWALMESKFFTKLKGTENHFAY